MFLESKDYIQFDSACAATSKELMAVYAVWCDDNGFAPLKSRTVSDFLIANAHKYHIEHTNNITAWMVVECGASKAFGS